jgi:uncharacterized phage-associated protein
MIINHQREKLAQAVVFFGHNMRKLGKVKLFKLLYFLDFEHFRDTGRSVTGLDYFAWKMGPVPRSLFEELDAGEVTWDSTVQFQKRGLGDKGWMLTVRPLAPFDATLFSRRELRLLTRLAQEFRDSEADDMVEATHLENSPWDKVWAKEGRKQGHIPYEYALRSQDADQMKGLVADREEIFRVLSK